MEQTAFSDGPVTRLTRRHPGWRTGMLAVATGLTALSQVLPQPASLGALAAGVTLFAVLAATLVVGWHEARHVGTACRAVADFLAQDAVPGVITDSFGTVQHANAAASREFRFGRGGQDGQTGIGGLLARRLPDPAPLLLRLQARAERDGHACEDDEGPRGRFRIGVHALTDDALAWRIEPLGDPPSSDTAAGGATLPMMTVGRGGTVLSMNDAARHLLGGRRRTLDEIFPDMPPRAGEVNEISTPEGQKPLLVAEIGGASGRRELFLLPPAEPGRGAESFAALPVPMLKLSAEGRVVAANADARILFGDPEAEGKRAETLMEGLGRPIADWLAEAAEGRGLRKSEFLRLRRDDRETFVQVTLSRVPDPGEAALLAVLNDATELKSLEAQFVQSQKMQAIGQLAGGVAHDFNNLLTAISGHCDLLLLRHDQSDTDYADLVQIHQNANRAAALVAQLLAFSRKQTLTPEVLDLRDTLSDLTHLLNRLVGETVELTLGHDPLLETVRADKRQVEQVLVNLVVNARDAMPDGGHIRIETENLSLARPMRRDRAEVPAGDYVCLRVIDEGSGIPPDKLQKVFEPFFTTKRTGEGTGLGLSTAYGKQTGGFIFADSVEGEGTCFTLLFPVHRAAAGSTAGSRDPDRRGATADTRAEDERQTAGREAPATRDFRRGASRGGVILLVEDEAPVRAFASRALQMSGHTVVEADCAEAALQALEDPSLKVDVFVTDVVMPDMDGPSWVRRALQERPDTRVVFVSGYAEQSLGEGTEKVPNSVFLPKPFSLTELTEVVGAQL